MQAALVVAAATGIYLTTVVLSRIFGQRHFMQASSYDLAFVFALGAVIGRVVLVRTTLLAGVLGLISQFVLHAVMEWLHHHSAAFHRLLQNRPVLVAAHGAVLEGNLRRAQINAVELYRLLRLQGRRSLQGITAVVLEPSGQLSVIPDGRPLDRKVLEDVAGAEHLTAVD